MKFLLGLKFHLHNFLKYDFFFLDPGLFKIVFEFFERSYLKFESGDVMRGKDGTNKLIVDIILFYIIYTME